MFQEGGGRRGGGQVSRRSSVCSFALEGRRGVTRVSPLGAVMAYITSTPLRRAICGDKLMVSSVYIYLYIYVFF